MSPLLTRSDRTASFPDPERPRPCWAAAGGVARARAAALALVACLALVSPQAASARDRSASPGAPAAHSDGGDASVVRLALLVLVTAGGVLAFVWIRPRPEGGPRGAAAPGTLPPPAAPVAAPSSSGPAATARPGETSPPEPPATAARRRKQPEAATHHRSGDAPGEPVRPGPAPLHHSSPDAPGEPVRPGPAPTLPPDPQRAWTAEIEWHESEGKPRFCVVCRAPGAADGTTVAESRPLDWPPTGPESVQALTDAAQALASSLAIGGWKALTQGSAWYAKRFAWEPVGPTPAPKRERPVERGRRARRQPEPAAAKPAARERHGARAASKPGASSRRAFAPAATLLRLPGLGGTPRPPVGPTRESPSERQEESVLFARSPAWPDETKELWRCEIKWDAGWVDSRFRAVVFPPRGRRGRAIGGSPALKWLLMSQPDARSPEHQEAVRSLATALEAAGWERVGQGAAWYSQRFSWRRSRPITSSPSPARAVEPRERPRPDVGRGAPEAPVRPMRAG